MAEPLKIAICGAASPTWGHRMSRDIIVTLSGERVRDAFEPTLVMEDVDPVPLEQQLDLARRVAEKAGGHVKVEATTDQKAALEGTRFVVVSIAQGTLEAMKYDLEIPYEYGVYQPVGDTASVGGALRAARNAPAVVGIARDLEAVGHPDAWILNHSNPMSMLCRAITRETKVNTVGCCHELYGGMRFLARILGFPSDEWRDRTDCDILGINHCGWMTRLTVDGEDGFERLRAAFDERGIREEVRRLYNSPNPDLTRDNVKINLFLRHGVLPYSGDRHTGEFFREFINDATNKGADFGVLLTTIQERMVAWRGKHRATFKRLIEGTDEIDLTVSEEAGAKIIVSLLLDEPHFDVANLPYRGDELPGVPDGAVLERLAHYSGKGIEPKPVAPLPPALHEHLVLQTNVLDDVVAAALTGDRALLVSALERDPLCRNAPAGKIPEMVGRLLDVHRESVHPGFF